jgi:hypothetical protein
MMLESAISLYASPRLEVKVREYASHPIVISGLVENGGTRYIQREAVPLFVICADAGVNSQAKKVTIRSRRAQTPQTYDLSDPKTAEVIVETGDELEFQGL